MWSIIWVIFREDNEKVDFWRSNLQDFRVAFLTLLFETDRPEFHHSHRRCID